jgi:hypothetical protein
VSCPPTRPPAPPSYCMARVLTRCGPQARSAVRPGPDGGATCAARGRRSTTSVTRALLLPASPQLEDIGQSFSALETVGEDGKGLGWVPTDEMVALLPSLNDSIKASARCRAAGRACIPNPGAALPRSAPRSRT